MLEREIRIAKSTSKILGSLHALRTLELTSSRKSLLKSRLDWRPIISSLPKTLKALIIDSRDSIFAVRNCAMDLDDGYIETTTFYNRGPSLFLDLGVLFPQLETLVLKGYRPVLFTEVFDDDDNVFDEEIDLQHYAGVPDTVTHLGLPYITLGDAAGGVKLAPLMPPSLTFLDTRVLVDYNDTSIEEIEQDWNLPHLERISMLEWYSSQPKNVSWLPRATTSLLSSIA